MKLLLAYDGSPFADAAIEDLARAGLPPQAQALVVSVADADVTDAEKLAEKACRLIRRCFPEWTLSIQSMWGPPAKAILDASAGWNPDLMIVGSHGRSRAARLFLGSVSLDLIHNARCSVRVARSRKLSAAVGPLKIVIGTDGSLASQAVIRSIAERSWPKDTQAKIVSAVQTLAPLTAATSLEASTYVQEPAYSVIHEADEHERERLRNVADSSIQSLRQAGLIASSIVADGDPRELILTAAEAADADAIFVGARGLGRMERLLLGSVSTYIVGHAHSSVEVVRQAGAVKNSGSDG